MNCPDCGTRLNTRRTELEVNNRMKREKRCLNCGYYTYSIEIFYNEYKNEISNLNRKIYNLKADLEDNKQEYDDFKTAFRFLIDKSNC